MNLYILKMDKKLIYHIQYLHFFLIRLAKTKLIKTKASTIIL